MLLLLNKCVQRVELLFPETAVLVEPLGGGLEQPSRKPAIRDTPFLHPDDEAGVLEDPKMFRNGGCGDIERFPEIADRTRPGRESFDHRAARWIGEGGKHQVKRLILIH
jgi:hypothetical protein